MTLAPVPPGRTSDVTSACPGCGLALPPLTGGPTHAYVGASPACWAMFSAWSGDSLADGAVIAVRQLVVDAYMVQHPGVPERRAAQSVGIHLMSLCLQLERGASPAGMPTMIARLLTRPPAFRWLDPPVPNGTMTIRDVASASDAEAPGVIRAYAATEWEAWAVHHATIRTWLEGSLR